MVFLSDKVLAHALTGHFQMNTIPDRKEYQLRPEGVLTQAVKPEIIQNASRTVEYGGQDEIIIKASRTVQYGDKMKSP